MPCSFEASLCSQIFAIAHMNQIAWRTGWRHQVDLRDFLDWSMCVCVCVLSQCNWSGYFRTSTDTVAMGEILGRIFKTNIYSFNDLCLIPHSPETENHWKCVQNIFPCCLKITPLSGSLDRYAIEISQLIVVVISILWRLSWCYTFLVVGCSLQGEIQSSRLYRGLRGLCVWPGALLCRERRQHSNPQIQATSRRAERIGSGVLIAELLDLMEHICQPFTFTVAWMYELVPFNNKLSFLVWNGELFAWFCLYYPIPS